MRPLLLTSVLAGSMALSSFAQKKPNIVFLITDDQHRPEFNFLEEGKLTDGSNRNYTPMTDMLSSKGVIFTNQYASSSVSTPSRYTCLTGTYASRAQNNKYLQDSRAHNQTNVHFNVHIVPKVKNVASILQENGYYTGISGKNHVLSSRGKPKRIRVPQNSDPRDPEILELLQQRQANAVKACKENGFDFATNIYTGNIPGNSVRSLEHHNLDWIFNGGLEFLESTKETEKPFFLYLGTTMSHGPGKQGSKYLGDPLATPAGMLDDTLRIMPSRSSLPKRLAKLGYSEKAADNLWLDDGIAALYNKLEEIGELDNTIIIYFNDHGVEGGKGSCYQGGVKSVGFVWAKSLVKGGRKANQLVSNIDFAPTMLDYAGIAPQKHMDGKSLKPILDGSNKEIHKSLFFEMGTTRAVIKDGFKYIAWRIPESRKEEFKKPQKRKGKHKKKKKKLNKKRPLYTHICDKPHGRGLEALVYKTYKKTYLDADQLYNINEDPRERTNLFNDKNQKKRVKALKKELTKYLNKLPLGFGEFKN